MAGELTDGLPEGLRAWVESRAAGTGRPPEEVVARAVTVHRLVTEYDGPLPEPSTLAAAAAGADATGGTGSPGGTAGIDPDRIDALAERLDGTDDRIEAVADEFDGKLTDVRERVVQVKREADGKADADHDHPELREAAEAAAGLAADVERAHTDLRGLESRVEAGFDSYEDVVERLADAVDDLDGKATTLARALADVRTRVGAADAGRERREAAADLKREANRIGAETAACGDCEGTVHVGLLSAPECPHCDCAFDGVEASSGWFGLGTPTLVVGTRPALADDAAAGTTAADLLGAGVGE